MTTTKVIGKVTAYAAAVEGGYTGTYEEFCKQQAEYAENAKKIIESSQQSVDAAAIAESAKEIAESARDEAESAMREAESAKLVAETSAKEATQAVESIGDAEVNAVNAAAEAAQSATEAAETAENIALIWQAPPIAIANEAIFLATPKLPDLVAERNLFDMNALAGEGITIENGVASGMGMDFYNNFKDGIPLNVVFKANTQYTLSFETYNESTSRDIEIHIWYTDSTNVGNASRIILFNNNTDYTKESFTSREGRTISSIKIFHGAGNSKWHFRNIKLQEVVHA